MRKHDSYKDSGIEWLGKIPTHWIKTKNRYGFCKSNNGKNESVETPVLSLTINGVKIKTDLNFGKSTESYIGHQLVKKGDIVFTPRDFDQTPILSDVSKFDGCISNLYIVDKTKEGIYSYFVNYFWYGLKYSVNFFKNFSHGIRYSFNRFQFDEIPLLLPPLHEQHQIVSFLDNKTSLIDKLIETKKRKIELLKEYRTSLINQVVTKGLNPNVEMKDSGVEWIGEIPSHWGVMRLKNVSDVKPSNVDKHIFPDEIQVRLCNYTDVYYNDFITEHTKLKLGSCNPAEFAKFKVERDDVIITKDSESPDDIGVPCLVKNDFPDVVCGYHLTLIRPYRIIGGYIFRFIQSDRTRSYFEVHSNGITRYGLGKSTTENLSLPFPPLPEQHQIVSYLDEKTSTVDKEIGMEERKIELLKEYRQSMISEVVTGKIKVTSDE